MTKRIRNGSPSSVSSSAFWKVISRTVGRQCSIMSRNRLRSSGFSSGRTSSEPSPCILYDSASTDDASNTTNDAQ